MTSETNDTVGVTEPAKTKKPGLCAAADALILEGGRTIAQIAEILHKEFPDKPLDGIANTVKIRPYHIKKAGKVPPPFAT